jgi:hypothetical protein
MSPVPRLELCCSGDARRRRIAMAIASSVARRLSRVGLDSIDRAFRLRKQAADRSVATPVHRTLSVRRAGADVFFRPAVRACSSHDEFARLALLGASLGSDEAGDVGSL